MINSPLLAASLRQIKTSTCNAAWLGLFLDVFPQLTIMVLPVGKTMKIRDLVNVQSFRNGVILRLVVEISGDTVYICTEKEWQEASADRRELDSVGFNRRYVMSGR